MPKLNPVGQDEAPDLEPVVIPIVAHTLKGDKVVEEFSFHPTLRPHVQRFLEGFTNDNMPMDSTLRALNDQLTSNEDRERWRSWYMRDDLVVESITIAHVFEKLLEFYGERPTRPSSGSSRSGARSGRTSKAAARSKA